MSELNLGCRLVRDGETVVLAPANPLGELNYSQFENDTRGALELLKGNEVKNVIVDLHEANHLGSNTINLFLRMYQQVERNHGRMVICRASPFVRELLEIMNLHNQWPICDSQEEAMRIVHQRVTRILLVDDCHAERCLTAGLLRKEPAFEIHSAEDGIAALEKLKETIPDIVLTDLIMPRMDGLELLDSIRQLYPQTPVILMTAYGNQSLANEALERGAVSYISKADRANRMVDTVKRIVRGIAAQRRGHLGVKQAKIDASFSVDNDHDQVCRLVDLVQQLLSNISSADAIEQLRMGVAVEEALLNALYHGNVEISAEQWKQADQNDSEFNALIDRLGYEAVTGDRRITLDAKMDNDVVCFVVRDQGPGFDTSTFTDFDSDSCFERGHRRGSMLISKLMDGFSHNDRGNEITLIKFPAS